jgi:hypothetical protein
MRRLYKSTALPWLLFGYGHEHKSQAIGLDSGYNNTHTDGPVAVLSRDELRFVGQIMHPAL